ncbi:MAG: hypothetical protein JNJ57_04530 [Saprospiraceae bacterium]|nr:hypothetical protein [Saprospiraceae bacterium]
MISRFIWSVLTIAAITATPLHGQVFAFIQGDDQTGSDEKVKGYKYQVTNQVFSALLKARGDYRLQAPELVMSKKQRYVAWMNPDLVQIGLEEKAYDICVSFGKDSLNALAALLSHELTHYYEKHDWNRHFVRENESIEAAQELERLEEGLKQEAQADYLGGFLALSVGYRTYGIMPALLKKVYQSYRLPDRLPGYPSLSDRLSMVESAMKRLEELSIIFEMANLLTVVGNYDDAVSYYRSILVSYQSREIYNNAGVNSLLAATGFFGPKEMPYLLPIELDPNTRMTGTKNVDAERLNKRKALLEDAVKLFDQAIALDDQYTLAYLNKGCALALLNEFEDAEYCLKKAHKRNPSPKVAGDLTLMTALVYALQNDKEQANSLFEQAQAKGSAFAKYNKDVFDGKTPAAPSMNNGVATKGVEQIEQFRLADFLTNTTVDKQVQVVNEVYCGVQQKPNSRVLMHYADNGNDYVIVQETNKGYTGATNRGISLKSTKEDIATAYGNPTRQIALPSGFIWVFSVPGIYFRFDEKMALSGWGVFLKPT